MDDLIKEGKFMYLTSLVVNLFVMFSFIHIKASVKPKEQYSIEKKQN